jgi:F-box/WD-40 domain protein 5
LPSRSETTNINYPNESEQPTLVPIVSAELNALIVGLKISSDHMFLLVNCRVSAEGTFTEQLDLREGRTPALSEKMEIHILKSSNLQVIQTIQGHTGWSQDCWYYILLDSSKQFIASGSEDNDGYVWDKASGLLAARLQGHSALVNCVAFNCKNEQMLVSASDDHSIRVGHSRNLARKRSQAYRSS